MSLCCECCVLSGTGLCDALITGREESYQLWCVIVCDQETSRMRRPWPTLDRRATEKKKGPGNSILCGKRITYCKCMKPTWQRGGGSLDM